MNELTKYIIVSVIGLSVGVICTLWVQAIQRECEKTDGEVASVAWRQHHFLLTKDNLLNELKAQGVSFPEIVTAQALIETDSFKSYACTSNNNLFGLRKKDGTYASFEHWTDCVAKYKTSVQEWKEPPTDYYQYLYSAGHAKDIQYILKLKQIVNK